MLAFEHGPGDSPERGMTDRLHHGQVRGSITDIVDSGAELLPDFELAAVAVLDGQERPGELPSVRRRLRAEGIRVAEHRGVLLLQPGELDRLSHVGMLGGADEVYLCATWNDEFEPFPGRISSDLANLNETTPLGLEEWMVDAGCVLALGDGPGLNFATPRAELASLLRARFRPVQG